MDEKSGITLDAFFEIWIKEKQSSVRKSTIYRHSSLYRNHIRPYLGESPLGEIGRQDVIALQNALYPKLKSSTTNMVVREFSSILKTAREDGLLEKNPCSGVPRVQGKAGESAARDTIHRALSTEETVIFLDYAKHFWYYELFLFLFNTGCRCGEASALRWSDIDPDRGVINIRRTVSRGADGLAEGPPKTKKSIREIPVNAMTRKVLEYQRRNVHVAGDDHVFFSAKGKRFTANLLNSDINNLLDGLERRHGIRIDRFSVHAARDTFATRALEAGMSPNTLKEILGHASLAMTMDLYAHVMPNTKQAEMQKVVIAPPERTEAKYA